MPKKAKSKAKSKAKLNIKKSKKGRRASPPKRRKVAVSIPALEAAATKAADFAAKHEAAAAESKGAAEQRRSDADAARQRRQSAMPPRVRLRSRRQTTGPQSSTRLLKRPGERPRVAKPQPSEQGLPPRRWRLLQRKQPTSPPSTKPPQRSQKAPRSNVVLTQMRQGRR
jgi:hypothetical protein